jgi:predicted GNAT superfamily acetyltransferase
MLAVRPEARNLGLGRRLKEFQRQIVSSLGGVVIYWTYDPLVARNAHLNFNVFGVRVAEYVEDMYGETASDLHRGIGTDRFIVAWPVADDAMHRRLAETHAAGSSPALREAPILNPDTEAGTSGTEGPAPSAERVGAAARVEVPADIAELQQRDPRLAARWRQTTRRAFHRAHEAGLVVQGFVVDDCAKRGYYLMTKPS